MTILRTANPVGFNASNYPETLAVDETNGYLYASKIFENPPGENDLFYKFSLTDLAFLENVHPSKGLHVSYPAVVKVPLDNLSGSSYYQMFDSTTIAGLYDICLVDETFSFLYVSVTCPYTNGSAYVSKINLSTFTEVGRLQVSTVVGDYVVSGAITSSFLYVVTSQGITKIDLSTFTVSLSNDPIGMTIDNFPVALAADEVHGYLYAAVTDNYYFGVVYRIYLSDLTVIDSQVLPFSQCLKAFVLDGSLYVTENIPGENRVSKIYLSTFTMVSTTDLTVNNVLYSSSVGQAITGYIS
jgi:hypothetical protein